MESDPEWNKKNGIDQTMDSHVYRLKEITTIVTGVLWKQTFWTFNYN